MTRIGVVCVAAKPIQRGHFSLIEAAAAENDVVKLFVSTSDRKRPGEVPIMGADMAMIWRTQVEAILPNNVNVTYGGSPIANAWKLMGDANEAGSEDTFTIYSDPTDLAQNFPENSLKKYTGNLWNNGQIILKPFERSTTAGISGTQMRSFIAKGDKESFIANLPPGMDGEKVWNVLSRRARSADLSSKMSKLPRRTEEVVRDYVKAIIGG